MASTDPIKLRYGMVDVYVDSVKLPVAQAGAAVFQAKPKTIEIDLYQGGAYDKLIDSWDVQLKLTFEEDNFKAYQLALSGIDTVDDGAVPPVIEALKDSQLLQSLRASAKKVQIHRVMDGDVKDFDITIWKAISDDGIELSYDKGKTTYNVTLKGLSRTGDPTQSGNFFTIGYDLAATDMAYGV